MTEQLVERTYELSHIQSIANELAPICQSRKKVAFLGEMGAGKTTLIQALCQALGSSEHATSPTFAIMNQYAIEDVHQQSLSKIWHIDLYRLTSMEEALDVGIEEYLDNNDFCFIEWPQIIQDLLPPETIWVELTQVADNKRKIKITNGGERPT
ncbi:MAG: tRNA (adenosine(37)-N6)-threonylcarbamoyltransferase complex ATPase subunit type 1 TsaE [Bacteroidetes bacterium SW_11_45_7]|nr:MAG: tRNA (adenosine(37)-N6)-threonylcarbamoyltransferase complex ATPase subunit type 1 TsaE [Bacteroidetes bacterium SW_11_45_7]